MSNTLIILPKGYLSWTQYDLWCKDPVRYAREYFMKGKKLDTKYLRFGKKTADLIEAGKGQSLGLIVYPYVEYEFDEVIDGVRIFGKVDTYSLETHTPREYKTGKVPWTDNRVYRHKQILYYAVGLTEKHKKPVTTAYLDWLETEEEITGDSFWDAVDKGIRLTGKVKTFQRVIDPREIETMRADIVRVGREISEAYIKFISETF